jgi:hypothetical protein
VVVGLGVLRFWLLLQFARMQLALTPEVVVACVMGAICVALVYLPHVGLLFFLVRATREYPRNGPIPKTGPPQAGAAAEAPALIPPASETNNRNPGGAVFMGGLTPRGP